MVNGIRTIYLCGLNIGFCSKLRVGSEFDKKHLKKPEGWNVVNLKIKTIVRIFLKKEEKDREIIFK